MYVNLERSKLRKKTKCIHDKIEERTGFQIRPSNLFDSNKNEVCDG